MANIMGSPASEIELPDSTGAMKNLFSLQADYTIVVFWDPTCGHCKEVLPQIDSFYRAKWKADGIKIFAVSKETDGTKKNWTDFIKEQNLEGWTHVYYSKTDDKARTDTGIPGYSQLYDVLTFPTIYLLDKDKRIVAKKLALEQINDVLQLKKKDQ
jgi:thiol-disulfide isomerase/thioredoxin